MTLTVISRKEAKEQGLKYYYTGSCKHGHLSPKFVSNYGCVACLHNQSQTPEYLQKQASFRASDEGKYIRHKHHAKERGVGFLLTFDEWIQIWKDSGLYHLRGNKVGCYVMGRNKDMGNYEVGNVSIIPFYDNFQVPNLSGGTHLGSMSVRECDDKGYPQV